MAAIPLLTGVPTRVNYTPAELDLLSSGGMPIVPKYGGKVYFVDYSVAASGDGSYRNPLKTLAEAHALMTADRDDVCYLLGGNSPTTYAQRLSATLTWSKNRCHLIGMNVYNRVAQRVSIRVLSGASVFTPFVSVTASGCLFANFHTFSGIADNSAQVNWIDTGSRNRYHQVHLGGGGNQTAADHAGCRDLVLTGGGEHLFTECTFGLDTVDRAGASANLELTGGHPRTTFENCDFILRADATSPRHLLIGSGGIDRYLKLVGCRLMNAGTYTGGSTLTEAMTVHASAGGVVIFDHSHASGMTKLENTASGRVLVPHSLAAATSGFFIANTG